jgi:hypothetical protein
LVAQASRAARRVDAAALCRTPPTTTALRPDRIPSAILNQGLDRRKLFSCTFTPCPPRTSTRRRTPLAIPFASRDADMCCHNHADDICPTHANHAIPARPRQSSVRSPIRLLPPIPGNRELLIAQTCSSTSLMAPPIAILSSLTVCCPCWTTMSIVMNIDNHDQLSWLSMLSIDLMSTFPLDVEGIHGASLVVR